MKTVVLTIYSMVNSDTISHGEEGGGVK